MSTTQHGELRIGRGDPGVTRHFLVQDWRNYGRNRSRSDIESITGNKMEWTLETVLTFLQPLLDAYGLDANNVFSVAFEPGGMELVQYSLDEDGSKIIVGDSIKMQSDFYPYLA